MRRHLLCGWLILAAPVLAAQSSPGPKAVIKQDFKTAGKAVGHAAVQVGHGVKAGAKAVGHAVRDGARKVGHGVRKVVHRHPEPAPPPAK